MEDNGLNWEELFRAYMQKEKENEESMKYASFIQQALFPTQEAMSLSFPQHFIFFRPKELVSGDFYWTYRKGNLVYLVVADCTGHGVPGAFLSILGLSFLNQIVAERNITIASAILNLLREYMMSTLQQKGDHSMHKDGIDMSLCILNTEMHTLQFAGAFNPLYLVRKDILTQYMGDNMPIGIAAETERPFRNHTIQLKKGDMLYLFSDGFADQFGGERNKKYKYPPFRQFLLDISALSTDDQKMAIEKEFECWKSDFPQLDDVLILGFRYC